jgi:hypothetical protein
MIFRQGTLADVAEVNKTSISHGLKENDCAEEVCSCTRLWTLEHEGKVLAVGGLKFIVPGTAWIWMNWSSESLKHIKTVYIITREWLVECMKVNDLRRVQAAVRSDFEEGKRMVEHLGFEYESYMLKFFPDCDAELFVKFAEKRNG